MKSLYTYICEELSNDKLIQKFKNKYSRLYNSIPHNLNPKNDILVISMCGATKNEKGKKEAIPAKEMFMGPANQTLLKGLDGLDVDWIILSGGYGMMNCNTKINFYDDVIMDIPKTDLKEMDSFLRYNEDLIKVIKKGNYKEIIFTLSDRWMNIIDLERIAEAAGENCKLITFLADNRKDDSNYKVPSSVININILLSYLKRFGAGIICIKEKITSEYLKHKKDYPDADIKTFIKNY